MQKELDISFLKQLPKTDLHVHLDGSLRPQTMLELAKEHGIVLPADSEDALIKKMHCGQKVGSLEKYLEAFDVTLSVMQTKKSLERIAFELAEDAANENVNYMEVRFAPMLSTKERLAVREVIEAILSGFLKAEKRYSILVRLIVCGLRHFNPKSTLEMAHAAVDFKNDGVVALDLAGPEDGFPSKDHLQAFDWVKKHDLKITIHAGEAFGPSSVREAIELCHADRIGHGCTLIEDPDLLEQVKLSGITLECCPSSNVQTGAVKSLAHHPLKKMFDLGVPISINTDNRFVTLTTVTEELFHCVTEMDFSLLDLREVILQGFEAAFLEEEEKSALILNSKMMLETLFEEIEK